MVGLREIGDDNVQGRRDGNGGVAESKIFTGVTRERGPIAGEQLRVLEQH
jgi:hypothetical protein